MNKQETAKILAQIKMGFPSFLINPDIIEFWTRHLRDIPFDKAQANLDAHIRSSSFEPKIADIVRRDETQFTNHEQLKLETDQRFKMLRELEAKSVTPEEREAISKRVASGAWREKYKNDPYLGGW